MTFLALGIAGAHSFTNGHASLRLQWMHPARPLWPEGTWVLWLATQFMWLGTICLLLSIYFIGTRNKTGWYLAMAGGITTAIANIWTHLVRGTTTDYLLGAFLGILVVVFMLIPFFTKRLLDESD